MILPAAGSAPGPVDPAFAAVRSRSIEAGETLAHVSAVGGHRADSPADGVAARVAWVLGLALADRLAFPGARAALPGPPGWEWTASSPAAGLALLAVAPEGGTEAATCAVRSIPDRDGIAADRSTGEGIGGRAGPDPPSRPWCLAALRPGIASPAVGDVARAASWIADWERCAAWAFAWWSRFADGAS